MVVVAVWKGREKAGGGARLCLPPHALFSSKRADGRAPRDGEARRASIASLTSSQDILPCDYYYYYCDIRISACDTTASGSYVIPPASLSPSMASSVNFTPYSAAAPPPSASTAVSGPFLKRPTTGLTIM